MASTWKWWPFCCITAVSAGSATRGENTACKLLTAAASNRWGCCSGRCTSQERGWVGLPYAMAAAVPAASAGRINVSAVPTAPWVFFRPLSSHLAHQRAVQTVWRAKQLAQWGGWRAIQFWKSKLITCFPLKMPSPLAATALATRIGLFPKRNSWSFLHRLFNIILPGSWLKHILHGVKNPPGICTLFGLHKH